MLLTNPIVRCLVIEKYPRRLAAPKAHAICPRSFELCRQFGVDTRALRQIGTSRDDAFWVNFLTNLNGEKIGVLPYERMGPDVLDDTPEVGVRHARVLASRAMDYADLDFVVDDP